MIIKTDKIFTDITDEVASFLGTCEKKDGLLHIFSQHTTAGLRILENETLLIADYHRFLEKTAPKDGFYAHNIIEARDVPPDERINGHSHIQSLFFNTSELIPIRDGKMLIGKWQRIFLVDVDYGRERTLYLSIFD